MEKIKLKKEIIWVALLKSSNLNSLYYLTYTLKYH